MTRWYQTRQRRWSGRREPSCIDEEGTTRDGEPAIRDGETRGNLPKGAWKKLPPAQHRATDAKKRAWAHQGEHFVLNAEAAREAGTFT